MNVLAYKQKVRRSFNQAANNYNAAAKLQIYSAEKLLEFTKMDLLNNINVLDLGSGTGFISDVLINHGVNPDNIISVDIAENMLYQSNKISKKLLCADADYLPFKNNSIDIVLSNLTLQWMPDLRITFAEIHRILKHNGFFIFSTLGEKTLRELRYCWKQIDSYTHVNSFLSENTILEKLISSGFHHYRNQSEQVTQQHSSLNSLMTNLKKTGAHNINLNAPKGLSGKNKFKQLKYCYEQYRNHENLLSASYELMYFEGRKT